MKKLALSISVALLALAPLAPAEAQWVLLARKASQRIQHMTVESERAGEPRREFVTVILEAPADRVFQTVLETVRRNPNARVLMSDPAARRLQVADGDRVGTVNVASMNEEVSQLMIAGTSPANEPPAASRVIATVMRICAEMKKQCTVE
jgi:hypothetical protein